MGQVKNGTQLAGKLAERTQTTGSSVSTSPAQTIAAYLKKIGPQLADVLPKHVDLDRLLRISLTTIRTNPKLLQCEMPSLMAAVMQAATLGLEPGLLGHCYIVPYGREATFIIGYKGMIDLARRSGNIQSISAREIYENDYFELTFGLEENITHIPWHVRTDEVKDQPGQIRGAYMVARFKDGGHFIHCMSTQEIEQHRRRSKAATNGPWVTDYVEMCKKTVVRAGWKWLPISIEIAEQVAQSDESTRKDITEPVDFILTDYQEKGVESEESSEENAPYVDAEVVREEENAEKNGLFE